MATSKAQVKHIAQLARLGLSRKEKEKFQKEFGSILGFVERLNEVNTEKVEPIGHITGLENVMREDKEQVISEAEKDKLLELLPVKKEGYAKVKAVL